MNQKQKGPKNNFHSRIVIIFKKLSKFFMGGGNENYDNDTDDDDTSNSNNFAYDTNTSNNFNNEINDWCQLLQ